MIFSFFTITHTALSDEGDGGIKSIAKMPYTIHLPSLHQIIEGIELQTQYDTTLIP